MTHFSNGDIFNYSDLNSCNFTTHPPHTPYIAASISFPHVTHLNEQRSHQQNPNLYIFSEKVVHGDFQMVTEQPKHFSYEQNLDQSVSTVYSSSPPKESEIPRTVFEQTKFSSFPVPKRKSMISNRAEIFNSQTEPKRSANVDSGSSGIYIALSDISALANVKQCNAMNRVNVTAANGESIQSTHTGQLQIPTGQMLTAYLFPQINGSLLSVSSFVDVGYDVLYSQKKVEFILDGQVKFEGYRDKKSHF